MKLFRKKAPTAIEVTRYCSVLYPLGIPTHAIRQNTADLVTCCQRKKEAPARSSGDGQYSRDDAGRDREWDRGRHREYDAPRDGRRDYPRDEERDRERGRGGERSRGRDRDRRHSHEHGRDEHYRSSELGRGGGGGSGARGKGGEWSKRQGRTPSRSRESWRGVFTPPRGTSGRDEDARSGKRSQRSGSGRCHERGARGSGPPAYDRPAESPRNRESPRRRGGAMLSPRERDSPRAKGLAMGEWGRERDRHVGRARPSPRMRCGACFVGGGSGFESAE